MRRLRTASTRRLSAILAFASVLAITAAVAQGALSDSGPTAAPKALANALLDITKAPEADGFKADIHFTNNLLPSGSLPDGTASPLVSGADGRLWIQKSGAFRLELKSDMGDAQIVSNDNKVTVYDASSNAVYRMTLPDDAKDAAKPAERDEKLTLAKVQGALDELAKTWTVSGADPERPVADRPTYTVKISPKDDGGLLGAAEVAWDAVRGAPLRAAIYAQGKSEPVLELKATNVSYDAVADSDVRITPPADAKVTDLSPDDVKRDGKEHASKGEQESVTGVAAVQKRVGFKLAVPAKLAGLPRKDVRFVTVNGEKSALTIYGEGFGAIAVLQHRADKAEPSKDSGEDDGLTLPEINIDGATGTELATALGTVVTFERDAIKYVVAGSVPPAAAENAARGLK